MKKILTILFVIISGWIITSCTESLEVDPTSVITTSSFWNKEEDAIGSLNGMYVELRSVSEAIYQNGEQRSEVFKGGLYGAGSYNILINNEMNADQPGHASWTGFYRAINTANLLLKYVPGITFKSESTKNEILAQAYIMRAYLYFIMTKTWGDLIIRTEPVESSDPAITIKERSSQEDVFKLIKEDIDKGIGLFPNNTFPSGRWKWSKPSANALKADVYLWTGKKLNGGDADFNTVLSAINEIATADVDLLPKFADLFEYTNKGNREVLMSIRYQDLDGATNLYWCMWIMSGTIPTNITSRANNIINPPGGGQNLLVITDLVRNQFTNDDLRKHASTYEIYTHNDTGDSTFYTTICLKGKGLLTGGSRLFLSDLVLYRYADILLMKAEAKNALGQDPSDEINRVRQRAYGIDFSSHVFVNGTKEENDAAILQERLFEFVYEGKRWWDLVRFGKAFDLVPALQSKKGKDYLLLFPIANSVLSVEPLVKQNPGY